MPTLTPDHTPNNVAYASRQGQPSAASPALAHQLSLAGLLSESAALKAQLAAQTAEITNLKSQLAAPAAENAPLKSAIPNPQSPPPSNLQSSICNLQSDNPQSAIHNPQSPDPIAAAFAPLFDNPVEHYIQGGGHTMPIIPREARTNQAGLERLKYLATRAELVLVEHVDRFAVCGIIGQQGQTAYEFITRNLWRLTAVRKSLIAMEANPNAPVPGELFPNLHATFTDCNQNTAAIVKEACNAIPAQSPSQSSPSPSPSQSSPVHDVNMVNKVNNVPPVPPTPAVPASPSISSVPQCPTYSPENLVRTLGRTATDLKIATPSPTQSSSPSEDSSVQSVRSVESDLPQSEISNLKSEIPSPPSALYTPPLPDPPCPKATANSADPTAPRPQCAECDDPMCPSRIAVPIFTGILKRTQKCDGACRFCSPKRQQTCPYTLPKFRDGPKK